MDTSALGAASHNILHVCTRETLRPLRDEVLRRSGFRVESTADHVESMSRVRNRNFDLVLVDVPDTASIHDAEELCSEIKTADPKQMVAFVCNWYVAAQTDCPDGILQSAFDPKRFLAGVQGMLSNGKRLPSA